MAAHKLDNQRIRFSTHKGLALGWHRGKGIGSVSFAWVAVITNHPGGWSGKHAEGGGTFPGVRGHVLNSPNRLDRGNMIGLFKSPVMTARALRILHDHSEVSIIVLRTGWDVRPEHPPSIDRGKRLC